MTEVNVTASADDYRRAGALADALLTTGQDVTLINHVVNELLPTILPGASPEQIRPVMALLVAQAAVHRGLALAAAAGAARDLYEADAIDAAREAVRVVVAHLVQGAEAGDGG